MNILTDLQIGYLAGIIDGEGYIGMKRTVQRRDYSYALTVNVANTNLNVLNWCKNVTNIGIIDRHTSYDNPKHKQGYVWRLHINDIPLFLMLIKAHLIIKKQQAGLLLEYLEKCQGVSGKEVSNEVLILRSVIYDELRELNKKGN